MAFEIIFINEDGETVNDNGREVRGKTKDWVIKRELSLTLLDKDYIY